jgi:ABC-type nitrate/sulfonate/bicarbonate transport system substrate-binding protein
MHNIVKLLCVTAASTLGLTAAQGQNAPLKLTLFGQPSVNNDAIWMAFEKGLYQEEGLDVTYRLFPSGTTAFQAFQNGQRDAKGYVVVAGKDIKTPQDLVGKTVATRVGSTGSWFISEYLTKNKIDPKTVTVKNLDTQVLPAALCGGEIAAFFIWQPVGSRTLEICPDKAHYLSDATGYVQGYLVAGARPEWLATPQGKDIATRWLRATMKGRDVAEKDFPAVAAYAQSKLSLSEKATKDQWDTNTRPLAIDKIYYDDFCSLSRWAQSEKATDGPIDFTKLTWSDGLKAINPKLVDAPPPPC